MAAVSNLVVLKPQPGRLEAFMRDVAKVDKIIKRLGGKLRAWNEVSGPNPGPVALVVEFSDWKDFEDYMAKREADTELQAFIAEVISSKSPNAEIVATGLNVEVPS